MKKILIFTFALGMIAFTSCSEKKAATAQAPAQAEVVTDSAFQNAAAGDYKSYDGAKVITLNSDFSVTVKGTKEYYKWELTAKPEGSSTTIFLDRKGVDADVQEQATLDVQEGALVLKNETYRKEAKGENK